MNNRPIKFRVWNSNLKKFEEDLSNFWVRPDDFSKCFMEWRPDFDGEMVFETKETDFIYQQFTGALDKKNQKIFEGDIVLFDNPDPYDGQDQLTKIVGYNSRAMGFRLYNFTHEVDKYGGQVFFPEEVEVIGNIFEGAIKDGINYGEYLKEK